MIRWSRHARRRVAGATVTTLAVVLYTPVSRHPQPVAGGWLVHEPLRINVLELEQRGAPTGGAKCIAHIPCSLFLCVNRWSAFRRTR
jgi:hypothetical protein